MNHNVNTGDTFNDNLNSKNNKIEDNYKEIEHSLINKFKYNNEYLMQNNIDNNYQELIIIDNDKYLE